MNYDRIIIELLDRINKLEEKVLKLEDLIVSTNSAQISEVDEKSIATRNKTKYIFEGNIYLKNRLVLEVVKKYILEHSDIDFEGLRKVFYDRLQGSFGVVRKKNTINDKNEKRYFMRDVDELDLSDGTKVVVSNQWGIGNINLFILTAKSLGYQIIEVENELKK